MVSSLVDEGVQLVQIDSGTPEHQTTKLRYRFVDSQSFFKEGETKVPFVCDILLVRHMDGCTSDEDGKQCSCKGTHL